MCKASAAKTVSRFPVVRSDHVYPTSVKIFYLSSRRDIDVSPFSWFQRDISWRFNVPLTLYNFNPTGNNTAKPVTTVDNSTDRTEDQESKGVVQWCL